MKNKLYSFLNSECDEAEYFSLSKDDLISLKEYLQTLKEKETLFCETIKLEEESIKNKCPWVESVEFAGVQFELNAESMISAVRLKGEDILLEAYYHVGKDKYITFPRFIPKFLCLSNNMRQMRGNIKSINNIQEELKSIDTVGKEIFSGSLLCKSVSDKFDLCYYPFEGVALCSSFSTLAFYGDNKPPYVGETSLSSDYQGVALNKILVKKD